MDLSIEDSKAVRSGAGLAVLVICLAIAFRCAIDCSLAMMNNSLTGTLLVVGYADDILDDMDRLRVDQRAFLSTGNDCFSDGIYESATSMLVDLDALEKLRLQSRALRGQILRVSDSVHSALDLVGRSNELEQSDGTSVALALLDGDANNSIEDARAGAVELKRLATDRILYRIQPSRILRYALAALF